MNVQASGAGRKYSHEIRTDLLGLAAAGSALADRGVLARGTLAAPADISLKRRLMSDQNESKPAPALGPEAMVAIGRELRRIYADIIAEGVPERFVEILRKLDEPGNEGETR
jgi:hypothetical protein